MKLLRNSPRMLPLLGKLASISFVVVAAFMLTACGSKYENPYGDIDVEDSGFYNNVDWLFDGDREDKLEDLVNDDFTIVVSRVIDKRRAAAYLKAHQTKRVMYEFNPDQLLISAPAFVQNELQKHMDFGPGKPHVYVAEVELKDARMRITRGDLFTGKWGRYVLDMQIEVLVRDENSLLLQRTPLRVQQEFKREGNRGRQPTQEVDRARMILALQQAFEPMAIDIAWQVRRAHTRRQNANVIN